MDNFIYRRGHIFWWRRVLRISDSRTLDVRLSLKTFDRLEARNRGAVLTAATGGVLRMLDGVPLLLILHAPHLAGSSADGHAHALVLPRRLTRFGWAGGARDLGSDAAAVKARLAWEAFRDGNKSSKAM